MNDIHNALNGRKTDDVALRGGLKFPADDVSIEAIANLTRAVIDLHARCAAKAAQSVGKAA